MEKEQLITQVRKNHQLIIDLATGKSTSTFYEEYEGARRELLELDPGILTAVPKWIYENRYGSEFWPFIKKISPKYQGRRDFINKSFAEIYDFIEKGSDQPISLSIAEANLAIENDYVDLLWKKIYSRRSYDKEGAVTACKTLIETVLKHLLDAQDIEHSSRDDIKDLYKKVSRVYGLEPGEQKSEDFTKLCSGYISIIEGIAAIRNKYSDAHGKSDKLTTELEQYHVDFVINSTGAISTFLLSLAKPSEDTKDEGQGSVQ